MSQAPTTQELLDLTHEIAIPLTAVERTMVLPYDRERHENVAEHSYILGVVSCALAERLGEDTLDIGKVAQFALVHDLVEIHAGDTTVWAGAAALEDKKAKEAASAQKIAEQTRAFPWVSKTIEAYERQESIESRFVYALDKILPHILIIIGDHHPVQPTWEAYLKTEEVALRKIAAYPDLLPYFQELCELFRQKPHFFAKKD